MHILDSLLAFSAYFFIGVAMVIIFLFIYLPIADESPPMGLSLATRQSARSG